MLTSLAPTLLWCATGLPSGADTTDHQLSRLGREVGDLSSGLRPAVRPFAGQAGSEGVPGLSVEIYPLDVPTPVVQRTDPAIDFTWGSAAPATGIPANRFGATWTGEVVPTVSGDYTFIARTDDGVRLYIDGALVIDRWVNQSARDVSSTVVKLKKDKAVTLRMEYYENTGQASARLSWSRDGGAAAVIPQANLRSADLLNEFPPVLTGPTSGTGTVQVGAFTPLDGGVIHYTVDGSDPKSSSPTVSAGVITLTSSTNLRAAVRGSDGKFGPVATRTITVLGGGGTGLLASYIGGTNPGATPLLSRTDAALNFNWRAAPPAAGLPSDYFTARWEGELVPAWSETTTFSLSADDGARVYLGGKLIIDRFHGSGSSTATVALTAGQALPLVVEYVELGGNASVRLRWQSASMSLRDIPTAALRPVVQSVPDATGSGLAASYFANTTLTGTPAAVRVEPRLDWRWGTTAPAGLTAVDGWSARWEGAIIPRFTETYTLSIAADDGVRVWVDGVQKLNDWRSRGHRTLTTTVALTAGRAHAIRVEKSDVSSTAGATLLWSSLSQQREVVPSWRLLPSRPPTVEELALAGAEDSTIAGTAVASDPDGDTLAWSVKTQPGHGSVTVNAATGAVAYVPNLNYNGSDSFVLLVKDAFTETELPVSVAVAPVNDAPVAAVAPAATNEDTAVTVTPSASDIDGGVLSWSLPVGQGPAHGTLSGFNAATGAVTYTPSTDYHGSDSFVLQVSDGLASAAVTVNVTVASVNDAPVASAAPATTDEDVAVTVIPTAGDVDGDALTWSLDASAAPAHGTLSGFDALTGTVIYTPEADWNGSDSFGLLVSDGSATVPLVISVAVAPVNDAPVASVAPAATDEDVAVTVTPSASDVDGDALSWTLDASAAPAHGTLSGFDPLTGAVVYTPNADWSGSDSFGLVVNDGTVDTHVTVTVVVAPVNDAPVLAGIETALSWFRDGDAGLTATAALTVSDVDSANLSGASVRIAGNFQPGDELQFTNQNGITGVWNAGSGTLALSGSATVARYQAALRSVKYRSTQAFPGTAARAIAFTVSDGSSSNEAARTLGVVTRSTPPWSEGFEGLAIGGDLHQLELQGLTRWHGWNAAPGASALVSATPARSGGASVAIAGATDLVKEYKGVNAGGWRYSAWQYIPTTFTGTSYFILLNTYRDTAGTDGKNWSTQVKFTNSQVLPDFAGGSAPVVKGQWVELRVDIDFAANLHRFSYNGAQVFERSWTNGTTGGGVLNLAAVDLFANGASPVYYDDISLTPIVPTISGGGSVAYLENAAPVPVMPALAVDGFGVAQLSGATVQLTGDLVQDVLSATVSGGISQSWNPATGTLTLSGNATPAVYQTVLRTVAFANGSDAPSLAPRTVAFSVTAPTGASNSVSATVTVTPVNDAPVAQALSLSGDEDTVFTGQALASDVDGGALTWSLASQPANGTATVDANTGAVSYQPNADYAGADSFGLTVSDGTASASTSVSVTVNAVDDAAVVTVPGAGSATLGSDLLLTGFAVADIDSATVSLTVAVDAGTISLPQLAASGATASNSGLGVASMVLDGTPAAVTAALAEVVWRAPEAAGNATLSLDGNGGHATVQLTASDAAAPITVAPLAATTWSSGPHGTTILPASRFWNLDVVESGRYHLWANGSGGLVHIDLDGSPVGELALPTTATWTCRNSAGAAQTLVLTGGATCRLSVRGDASITSLILVAETPAGVQHDDPVLVGLGTVAVIDAAAYDHSTPAADGWSMLPSGGAMVGLPDTDLATSAATRLDYDLYVVKPGTYRLWVKAMGNVTGDSVWVGLDGVRQPNYVTHFGTTQPQWSAQSATAVPIDVSISSAGHHVLNLWMREDGVSVTQLAVSGVTGWAPAPTASIAAQVRQGPLAQSGTGFAMTAISAAQLLPGKAGTTWTTPNSGPGLQALPDAGTSSNFATAPSMTWWLNVTTPGTREIWLRTAGPDTNGDTIFASLDGSQINFLTYVGIGPSLPLTWTNRTADRSVVTFTVAPADVGLHAFTLWMREDGLVLERASLQVPGQPVPTGDGPALSVPETLPTTGGNG